MVDLVGWCARAVIYPVATTIKVSLCTFGLSPRVLLASSFSTLWDAVAGGEVGREGCDGVASPRDGFAAVP